MTQEYPLKWPDQWPRTNRPVESKFNTSLSKALNNVRDSIRKFASDSGKKVENVVISSNVTLGCQKPSDSGVSIYFSWDGISTCIAVDRYAKVEDNLQAIHHCIEAERTKLRHGGLNLVRAAFRGYAALPPPNDNDERCWRILGIKEDASLEEITAAFKQKAKKCHPDTDTGSTKAMSELNYAYNVAKKIFLCRKKKQ